MCGRFALNENPLSLPLSLTLSHQGRGDSCGLSHEVRGMMRISWDLFDPGLLHGVGNA